MADFSNSSMPTLHLLNSSSTAFSSNATHVLPHKNCSLYLPSTYMCHSIPDEVVVAVHTLILLFNFLGNGVVIIVIMCKRSIQTFTNYMILNLSIADVVIGIVCVAMETPMEIEPHKWVYGKVGCKLLYPMQTAMIYVSVFILVVLSCGRYVAIVHPYRTPPSPYLAKVVLLIIWILSLLLVTPYAVSLQVDENTGLCEEKWTRFQGQVFTAVTFGMQYVIPMILIISAYVLIIYDLNRDNPIKLSRQVEALKQKENMRITKLVIIVTTAFAICLLPHHTIAMWLEFGDGGTQKNIGDISILAYFMLYLNSGLDPVLYNLFNSVFRTELKKLRSIYRKRYGIVSCTSHQQENCDAITMTPVRNNAAKQMHLLQVNPSASAMETESTRTTSV